MQNGPYTLSARVSPAGQNRRFIRDFTRAFREKRARTKAIHPPTAFSNDVNTRDGLSHHVIQPIETIEQTKQQSSSRCNVYWTRTTITMREISVIPARHGHRWLDSLVLPLPWSLQVSILFYSVSSSIHSSIHPSIHPWTIIDVIS
jgi:hypothetical protein